MKKAANLAVFVGMVLVTLSGCGGHAGMAYHGRGGSDVALERGLGEMRTLIDSTVKDPGKAAQAKEMVEAIVAEVRTSTQQSRAFHQQLYDLNANYGAAPEDFLKILDELNNARMKSASRILGLRFKMKDLMTAEEWKALSDQMLSYSSKYQHGSAAPTSSY